MRSSGCGFEPTRREAKEAGFTLLELLLVIGIGALLLLSALAVYRMVTRDHAVNEALRLLISVKQETRRAFEGQRSYGPAGIDLVPVLAALKAFPAGTLDNTNIPRDPWGNPVQVIANDSTFQIVFSGILTDACMALALAFDEADSDLVSLDIDRLVYGLGGVPIEPGTLLHGPCESNPSILTWEFF